MSDTNTTDWSIFDFLQHDDEAATYGDNLDPPVSSKRKATELLMIGIILLSIVLLIDCVIRCYFICKSRKQKRLVVPSPEGVMAAVVVTVGTDDIAVPTLRRVDEDEEIEDGESGR
ncbi:hypothetical protein IV203_031381 [Nitzschia inconspicua]|uniref:Uncharacterized protein n=1 Tax=Nitzschia inconspicua TaxID=303405 RepID=A0A9K3Q2L5_9STRA|nr:hypothetical protein IV203_031381 [Nitzschia inconspicua]